MAKHALVVGSQTAGLEGPIGDAAQMAAALEAVGFQVDLRTTAAAASREGILEGYERLIQDIPKDGAAVFYYSGHGVRVRPNSDRRNAGASGVPRVFQALVPTDFEESTAGEFRGILDLELSVLLGRLTDRTRNVTVILDCCHAAAMSRDVAARPKALLRPCHVELEDHVERLRARGLATEVLTATGNPHAVRLVAAGQSESAYERQAGGAVVGTFTESLLLRLREAEGQRLTWDALGRSVRERVLSIHPTQRVDIEGPRRRYLFEVEEAPRAGAVTMVAGEDPTMGVLRAGRLHGVHAGDQYAVLPGGATGDTARRIATAVVTRADPTASAVALHFMPPAVQLPLGAQAFPILSAAPRRAIRLIADGTARQTIANAITATGRFTIADSDDDSILATVKLEAAKLELLGPSGVAVVPASKWPADSLDRLIINLRMLTAAQALRELESEPDQLPEAAVEVTWGLVEAGEAVELPTSGELISVGARLFVRITNRHPRKRRLYVSIFDIGVAQRIQLLTDAWPAGYELEPGEPFTLGEDASGKLVGVELGWSDGVPEDGVRTESLIVIVTERACDLTAAETPGATSAWETGAARGALAMESPLQQLVRQFQYGRARDVVRSGNQGDGHLVRHISFELSPWPLPPRGKGFLLDDRLSASVLVFGSRGRVRAPRKIAIRITKFTIHDTRAWFGSTDIRLDTLVITRSKSSGGEPYCAATLRFNDDKFVPLDNALVYHGDAVDFVDFRVWASRDRDDRATLAELLNAQGNSAEVKNAAAALLAISAGSTGAAPMVAAVGAAATLTAVAWKVLSAALPETMGLYQTSFLTGEGAGFGQGRPSQGMLHGQGVSFGYEIVAVD